jgi:hypothetical protein
MNKSKGKVGIACAVDLYRGKWLGYQGITSLYLRALGATGFSARIVTNALEMP